MAYVQKRQTQSGATAYIVKWRTPDGKHKSRGGFRTRKAANAYATDVEHALARGTTYDPKAGGITFREAATVWLNSRSNDLKETTAAGYRRALAPVADRRKAAQRLSIDAVFGGYPLNAIKREQITAWVADQKAAGKSPVTIRHAVLLVKQVLAQAVADKRLHDNPADYVTLPGERGTRAVVDDPAQFLTAAQVTALTQAVPWPYDIYVHVAAWAGLRAAELAGLQVGDVELPALTPTAAAKPGMLRVERTIQPLRVGNTTQLTYLAPKTQGSRRRVPLTAATTALLRGYLAEHPRASDPSAPLFPGITAHTPRLVLDWATALRHSTFYVALYRPAVARVGLPAGVVFHSLRHTYVSLCVAAGIPPLQISRFAGHSKVTTTLGIYAHLFADDHADAMAALGAMAAPKADNVIRLRG